MPSLNARLDDLEARLHPARRYVQLRVELRKKFCSLCDSKKPLKQEQCQDCGGDNTAAAHIAFLGGTWDRFRRKYIPQDADKQTAHVIRIQRSQVLACERFLEWLAAYKEGREDRVNIEMYADKRRGGKTFFMVLCLVLFCIDSPRNKGGDVITWCVVPNYPRQREIRQTIGKIIPADWMRPNGLVSYRRVDRQYVFANGASLYIKSGDDEDALKEGGVSLVGINEAQQIHSSGVLNCMGNNIDDGGLTIIALNPPEKAIGLWAMNLHEAIDNGELPCARATSFPPDGNFEINQAARSRFSAVAKVIDPQKEKRDGQGLWLSIHDLCYPFFDKHKHMKPLPVGWEDVTSHINGMMQCVPVGTVMNHGVGADFQRRPWCAAALIKAFRAPPGNELKVEAGTICYWVIDECVNDVSLGQFWTEEKLAIAMIDKKWSTDDTLVIGDASGSWQGASGAQRGKASDPTTWSFPILEEFGWTIRAPQEAKEYKRRTRQSVQTIHHAGNPPVPERLDLVNTLLSPGGENEQLPPRLYMVPEVTIMIDSFRKCEADASKKPKGKGAHATDAAGYYLYRAEMALQAALKRDNPVLSN